MKKNGSARSPAKTLSLPLALEMPALATVGLVAAVLSVLIAYETVHFAELRERLRHQLASEGAPD